MGKPEELPRLDKVFVGELAFASGLSEETIIRRMRLSETEPTNPRAIPYLKHLGKPYCTTRQAARRFLSLEGTVNFA